MDEDQNTSPIKTESPSLDYGEPKEVEVPEIKPEPESESEPEEPPVLEPKKPALQETEVAEQPEQIINSGTQPTTTPDTEAEPRTATGTTAELLKTKENEEQESTPNIVVDTKAKPLQEEHLVKEEKEVKVEKEEKVEIKEEEKIDPKKTLLDKLAAIRPSALIERRKRRQKNLEDIMALALEFKKKDKHITNDDVEKLLHVSDRTATRYLSKLTKMGMLTRQGSKKGVIYSLPH